MFTLLLCLVRAYSPRAVFKGGGKCVRVIVDSHAPPSEELPRDEYRERIVNVEKTREKDKEIQRPMAIPSNKPLSCGKYFVKDVLSNSSNSGHLANNDTNADHDAARRHYAHYPPSPEKDNAGDTLTHQESAEEESVYARLYHNAHGSRPTLRGALALPETPTTGEYVSHPQWRDPNPRKWVGGKFVSTVASTNVHTAHQRSIDGSAAGPTLLIEDQYAPISVFPLPTSPAVHEFVRTDMGSHDWTGLTVVAGSHRSISGEPRLLRRWHSGQCRRRTRSTSAPCGPSRGRARSPSASIRTSAPLDLTPRNHHHRRLECPRRRATLVERWCRACGQTNSRLRAPRAANLDQDNPNATSLVSLVADKQTPLDIRVWERGIG